MVCKNSDLVIKGFYNVQSEGYEEFIGKVGVLREKGIDVCLLPTSGCYTLHLNYETGVHHSCYGVNAIRFALDGLLKE